MADNKHYDAALTGVWWGSNYGSILNGYAIYRTLKKMDYSVLMIQKAGNSNEDWELHDTHNTNFIREWYDADEVSPNMRIEELKNLNSLADTFIAGSDQIWNYGINRGFGMSFLLNFVDDDKKKISIGTSFGHSKDFTPEEEVPYVTSLFRRFDAISVREEFGAKMCKDLYGVNARVVVEPVFFLDKEEYLEIAAKSQLKEEEPYIVTYMLDPTPEKIEAIKKYEKITGLKSINILDGDPRTYEDNKKKMTLEDVRVGIDTSDFLNLYNNAKFVMTDSFHGTAFAVILNKPFLSITNFRRGPVRFVELLKPYALENRVSSDPKNIIIETEFTKEIDYTEINEIIKERQNDAKEWIKYVMDTPKEELPPIINKSKAIVNKLDMSRCMGCGACVNTCPTGALSIKPDKYGYYKSTLDSDKCIDCGKCQNVCAALNLPERTNSNEPVLYAAAAADEHIADRSSSGGIFTLLSNEILNNGGVVVGASWDDEYMVRHIFVDNREDLPKLQKSKYMQSYLGDAYSRIKEVLESGKKLLFSGCPCQCAGLRKFLGRDYDNLFIMDIMCSNAPSAKFFKKYVEENFQNMESYEFRYKGDGDKKYWDCNHVKVTVKDGEELKTIVRNGASQDDYQKVYHDHTMCPAHCEKCEYQKIPRYGDITIGDFWGIRKKLPETTDINGVSAVLINNQKGEALFNMVPQENFKLLKQVELEWLGANGYAVKGKSYASPDRDKFYAAINRMTFNQAANINSDNKDKPRKIYDNQPVCVMFDSRIMGFKFDSKVWEEHIIDRMPTLMVKPAKAPLGNYASLMLGQKLVEGEKYVLKIRFKIRSEAKVINLHVKQSGVKKFQIVHSCDIDKLNDGQTWIEKEIEFTSNSSLYDEFMVGAAQIKGKNNFMMFDYIFIERK